MNKFILRVDDWMKEHKVVPVQLKKGLVILLFSVTTTNIMPASGYEYNLRAENSATNVQLSRTGIGVSLERNNQQYTSLSDSLMRHRGHLMNLSEMNTFRSVAEQVSNINFTDSMVCYDEVDRQVTFDLLTMTGMILHLTQYFEEPTDQVVYSVERNGKFLCAGYLPIANFSSQLLEVIYNAESAS